MKVKIHDLKQFFKFAQIHKYLTSIAEDNHSTTYKEISKQLKNTKQIIQNSLKINSPLQKFYIENKLKLIDLDLIQIALLEQTRSINPEKYLEKSILEQNNKTTTPKIINKLKKSTLIEENYLELENPFEEEKNNDSKKEKQNILNLLNSKLANKTSKEKLEIKFSTSKYTKLKQIIEDVNILDKIITSNINNNEGISKKIINETYKIQLKNMQLKYKLCVKKQQYEFSKFLNKNKISFEEIIAIIKLADDDELNKGAFEISDELIAQFEINNQINKLVKKELITKEWWRFELSNKTKKELGINIDKKEGNDVVKIEIPKENFKNLCLDKEIKNQLLTTINQQKNKDLIFNKWGLGKSIGYGKGITLNLSGPPGTGKTLSAKAIANQLHKKLLTINYPQLESAWVGGTEKNISEAFAKAKKEKAVLFFDEADSLTTKRQNASATWIISRTNTLLKELEAFDGVCIFATNFSENYDEAFNRRLSAHIKFKLPNQEQLAEIFKIHFPRKEAIHKDVDFFKLSKKITNFSGGDVKNVVLNAARIASNDETNTDLTIKQKHLLEACTLVQNGKINQDNFSVEETTYFG